MHLLPPSRGPACRAGAGSVAVPGTGGVAAGLTPGSGLPRTQLHTLHPLLRNHFPLASTLRLAWPGHGRGPPTLQGPPGAPSRPRLLPLPQTTLPRNLVRRSGSRAPASHPTRGQAEAWPGEDPSPGDPPSPPTPRRPCGVPPPGVPSCAPCQICPRPRWVGGGGRGSN